MVKIMTKEGFKAMFSKNFSAIMRYHANKSPIIYVRITEYSHSSWNGSMVYVRYLNGSFCETEFGSYKFSKLWFARKRSVYAKIDHIDSTNVNNV